MPFELADPIAEAGQSTASRDELWLLGQPSLTDYLDVAKQDVAHAPQRRDEIIAQWRAANDYLADLEEDEAGLADKIRSRKLPKEMRSLAEDLQQQDFYRDTFDRVPTTIEMVELDRIVVSQRHVTLPFVQDLAAGLDSEMTGAELFHFCQPLERRDAPVECRRLGRDRYAFLSDSSDLRYHETTVLRPEQISDLKRCGPVAGVVGIIVGHGSNFLSGIRWGKRIVLHNGYHRATALRMAGIKRAPVIVQTVSRRDELDLVAAPSVVDDPAFYFRSNRPPLLKDFFDPELSIVLPVKRKRKMIEVSFSVNEIDVEDL
ncbi:hypothetical protein ACMA5I_08235 [Paracoccaceae bacterium GXU_MW_L88]